MSLPTAALVRIGVLTGAHGLKGALRLRPDNADVTALRSLARIHIQAAGSTREYRVRCVSSLGRDHLRVVLEGIDGIEAAQALKGAVLLAAASDLPALKPGEFYYFQVIGMEVRLGDGKLIGRIEEVFFTGSNDVWVVRGEDGEALIPVIEDVVKRIDFDARCATIEAIPGLLD
jgi:16S rRNA processing protein RimM